MNRALRTALLLSTIIAVAGCAVRLGGGGPQHYNALALHAIPQAGAADVAAQIRAAGGDLVLLSGTQDSAWFAAVAEQSQLTLSGPGRTGPRGLAFLSRLEVLGDTSLIIEVPGGGRIHMHDALLRVGRDRHIDLMMVNFDVPDLRAAVRHLLEYYVARDVMPNVPVLLAIDGPTVAVADSAATLMRVYYAPTAECPGAAGLQEVAGYPLRLVYGPSALISCTSARVVGGNAPGIHARVVVGR
jgi:hypothetical protein